MVSVENFNQQEYQHFVFHKYAKLLSRDKDTLLYFKLNTLLTVKDITKLLNEKKPICTPELMTFLINYTLNKYRLKGLTEQKEIFFIIIDALDETNVET